MILDIDKIGFKTYNGILKINGIVPLRVIIDILVSQILLPKKLLPALKPRNPILHNIAQPNLPNPPILNILQSQCNLTHLWRFILLGVFEGLGHFVEDVFVGGEDVWRGVFGVYYLHAAF
jgi:hypothetical protein